MKKNRLRVRTQGLLFPHPHCPGRIVTDVLLSLLICGSLLLSAVATSENTSAKSSLPKTSGSKVLHKSQKHISKTSNAGKTSKISKTNKINKINKTGKNAAVHKITRAHQTLRAVTTHNVKKHNKSHEFKTAHNSGPAMPEGYQEKSTCLLQAYRLRKDAWNEVVSKNYAAALTHLSKAISLTAQCYGDNSQLLLPLYLDQAFAAEEGNQPDQAASALSSCLKLNPVVITASSQLALVALRQGNLKEALSVGQQALHNAPKDPRAHLLMSLILSTAGQHSQAAQEKVIARQLYNDLSQIRPETDLTPVAHQTSQPLSSSKDNEGESDTDLELP